MAQEISMTIASELQNLQSNLTAAKTAVTTKGGTVGDTGLAGLASEIASIPSGGALDNYGSIVYLDTNNVEQTLTLATEDDYIELTLGQAGSIVHINGASINKSNIKGVTIAEGVQYIPDRFCYGCTYLISVVIPSTVHFIGHNVFANCNIITANFSLENVLYIGGYFMMGNGNFNTPINLPKIIEIGDNFLMNCVSFNSSITLNDNMETIGVSFLNGCSVYAQPFSIPSGLIDDDSYTSPIGGQLFYNCYNFTGPLVCNVSPYNIGGTSSQMNQMLATSYADKLIYTTGITLTGPYAEDWKTKFPDRTSMPYRKLIVGS